MAKTTSAADTLRTGAARGINNGRLVLQQTRAAAAVNTANAANAIKSNASFVYKPSSGSADSSGGETSSVRETVVNQETPQQTTVNQNLAAQPESRFKDDEIEKMDVDEIDKILATDGSLTAKESDALKKAKETKQDSTNNDANTFRFRGRTDDPDFAKPEEDKFDIQQGDFIEFLMKDVVLASAAWATNKTAKWIGVGAYEFGSWAWHKMLDGKEAKEKEDAKKAREKASKAADTLDQKRKNSHDNKPLPEKDTTTAFANQLFSIHDAEIAKPSSQAAEANAFFHLTKAALEMDEKNFNDLLTKKSISPNASFVKLARERAEFFKNEIKKDGITDPKKVEAEKKNFLDSIAATVEKHSALTLSATTFTANYAAAAMLQEKIKNPDAFANTDLQKEFLNRKQNEAKKLFYLEAIKLMRGGSNFKNLEDLTQAGVDAFKTARDNIEKGQYAERGKLGENKPFSVLQKTLENPEKKYQKLSAEDMKGVAVAYIGSEQAGNQRLEEVNARIAAEEEKLKQNDSRRQNVEDTKKRIKNPTLNEGTNKEKFTPAPTRGREY